MPSIISISNLTKTYRNWRQAAAEWRDRSGHWITLVQVPDEQREEREPFLCFCALGVLRGHPCSREVILALASRIFFRNIMGGALLRAHPGSPPNRRVVRVRPEIVGLCFRTPREAGLRAPHAAVPAAFA